MASTVVIIWWCNGCGTLNWRRISFRCWLYCIWGYACCARFLGNSFQWWTTDYMTVAILNLDLKLDVISGVMEVWHERYQQFTWTPVPLGTSISKHMSTFSFESMLIRATGNWYFCSVNRRPDTNFVNAIGIGGTFTKLLRSRNGAVTALLMPNTSLRLSIFSNIRCFNRN